MRAYNDYVVIIRDETPAENNGLTLPPGSREKPHEGTIHSVGSLVEDENLRKAEGRKCLFHKGVGQEIEYEGQIYVVMYGREVIGEP